MCGTLSISYGKPQVRKKVILKVFTCETKQTIQGFTGFNFDKEIAGLISRIILELIAKSNKHFAVCNCKKKKGEAEHGAELIVILFYTLSEPLFSHENSDSEVDPMRHHLNIILLIFRDSLVNPLKTCIGVDLEWKYRPGERGTKIDDRTQFHCSLPHALKPDLDYVTWTNVSDRPDEWPLLVCVPEFLQGEVPTLSRSRLKMLISGYLTISAYTFTLPTR
ncbi:hypothetical protein DAPPUDRAFT_109697 [Daphnia pulex]|uniref:Uncharacterized protein n=1 Tax=Daphnia pulex TaxID=6669 RepID=E9H3X0_DAPPU|nr:hypothetical protein DAPPUDRAFT_109697 [Daphnia pulex]|eukprot:EFX73604.1 hypothetical protein DAPPUDRAFT_109697 [Daphnia pulex]